MRWLLHGEGPQSPFLTESLEEGQHPWKALNSDFLWPRQSRGLKLTLVVRQIASRQELALHCIQRALWSSQLEHAVLENCMCQSQSLQGPCFRVAISSCRKVGQKRPGGSSDAVPAQLGRK